jgi:hypothetical protein
MKKNMGSIDRMVRVLAAISIIVLYSLDVFNGTVGVVLLALAAIFCLTGIVGFCPLYWPFHFSTKGKKVR